MKLLYFILCLSLKYVWKKTISVLVQVIKVILFALLKIITSYRIIPRHILHVIYHNLWPMIIIYWCSQKFWKHYYEHILLSYILFWKLMKYLAKLFLSMVTWRNTNTHIFSVTTVIVAVVWINAIIITPLSVVW